MRRITLRPAALAVAIVASSTSDFSAQTQAGQAGRVLTVGSLSEAGGRPSPDGTRVAFRQLQPKVGSAPALAGLAIGNFVTGAIETVVFPTTDGQIPLPLRVAWAPDGKALSYSWCTPVKPNEDRRQTTCELRIKNLDTGAEQTLVPRRSERTIPWLFTPDGREVLTILVGGRGPTTDVVFVNIANGSSRPLLRGVDASDFDSPGGAFSPDGKCLAFTRTLWIEYPFEASAPGDIEVMATDGSQIHRTVAGPADEKVVAWSPDGRSLLFTSDTGGTTDLWQVAILEGRTAGEPTRLAKNVGAMSSAVITPGGDLVFQRDWQTVQDVMAAPIESTAPLIFGTPASAVADPGQRRDSAAVSPDGSLFVYRTAPRTPRPTWPEEGMNALGFQSRDGRVRHVPLRHRCANEWTTARLSWAPDAQSLLLTAHGSANTCRGLFKIDAVSGAATPVIQQTAFIDLAEVLADGKSILYVAGGEVRVRDVDTAEDRLLLNLRLVAELEGGIKGFALSADRRIAAFMGKRHLLLLTLPEGTTKIVPALASEGRGAIHIAWLDATRLIAADATREDQPTAFWLVPLDGSPVKTNLTVPAGDVIASLRADPDKRRIVYDLYRDENPALVILERVLPPSKAGASRQ
jgi:dipeptidyl aminopeptidase/acylaminoacyl peptidase